MVFEEAEDEIVVVSEISHAEVGVVPRVLALASCFDCASAEPLTCMVRALGVVGVMIPLSPIFN